MREIDGYLLGHQVLAGVEIKERRPRGGGRKIIVAEDGRKLPHLLLPIERVILEHASLLEGETGESREVTPNMLMDELGSTDEQKEYRLSYENVNMALKRLDGWGYMSSRVVARHGTRSARKAYSITPEGLTRIED